MKIHIKARLYPTEDPEKVKKAILNIFPDAKIEISEGSIVAISKNLDNMKKLLETQHIRDTAREILTSSIVGNHIIFKINKQVATVGKINFSISEGPLGDVEVDVDCEDEDAMKVIDYVAPSTLPPGTPPKKVSDEDLL